MSGLGWIVLELLAPLTARHLVLGAMHHRGAVAHWQGVCHRVLGDLHAAEGRLRQALAEHEDLDCPHWIALSATALAHTLHQQDPASTEAATLLQRTHHIADTHGMTTLTNRYTRHGLAHRIRAKRGKCCAGRTPLRGDFESEWSGMRCYLIAVPTRQGRCRSE